MFVGDLALTQVSNIAYELLVARRGHHVPFVTFGHWQWGDIDRGRDVFKDFHMKDVRTRRDEPAPHASSAPHSIPLVPLAVMGAVAATVLISTCRACCEECREEQTPAARRLLVRPLPRSSEWS